MVNGEHLLQGSNGNRNIIRDNSIGGRNTGTSAGAGPQCAIKLIGTSGGDGTEDNEIRDNYISNIYYRAIYIEGADGTIVDGNELTNPHVTTLSDWGTSAIYLDNWNNTTNKETNINANRIHHNHGTTGSYRREYHGVYVYDAGDGDAIVSNNAAYDLRSSGTLYGYRSAGIQ